MNRAVYVSMTFRVQDLTYMLTDNPTYWPQHVWLNLNPRTYPEEPPESSDYLMERDCYFESLHTPFYLLSPEILTYLKQSLEKFRKGVPQYVSPTSFAFTENRWNQLIASGRQAMTEEEWLKGTQAPLGLLQPPRRPVWPFRDRLLPIFADPPGLQKHGKERWWQKKYLDPPLPPI